MEGRFLARCLSSLRHQRSRRRCQVNFINIILGQPLCPVVGRRRQHAVSKLACIVQSSARSYPASICLGRPILVIWSPSGDTRGPSVDFEAIDMPCSEPLHFSHIADYDFCPIFDPDVGLSLLVCDVEQVNLTGFKDRHYTIIFFKKKACKLHQK